MDANVIFFSNTMKVIDMKWNTCFEKKLWLTLWIIVLTQYAIFIGAMCELELLALTQAGRKPGANLSLYSSLEWA